VQKIVTFPHSSRPEPVHAVASVRHSADPLGYIERAHEEQLRICDLLEDIADSLPLQVDRLKCYLAASRLKKTIRVHQQDEERGLFPVMRRHPELQAVLLGSLDRLESEHIEDESLACDIIDSLDVLARGEPIPSVDGLSFMLRAFFDSHRRHIAFEMEALLPQARAKLSAGELEEIERVMLANRAMPVAGDLADADDAPSSGWVPGQSPAS
jgi:hemerythrin-like domain-containing protein